MSAVVLPYRQLFSPGSDLLLSTCLPNLKSLPPPTKYEDMKFIQNLEKGLVLGSLKSLKVTENSANR